MTHRGACGCEENTGDGAGILVAVPDGFLRKAAREAGIGELPAEGEYAVGNIFVPKFENAIPEAKAIVERVCKQRGMKVRFVLLLILLMLGWCVLLLLLLRDLRGARPQAARRKANRRRRRGFISMGPRVSRCRHRGCFVSIRTRKCFDFATPFNPQVIGWRDVPFDNSMIGDTAKGTEPHVVQVFVENSQGKPNWDFERELYRVRKVTAYIVSFRAFALSYA